MKVSELRIENLFYKIDRTQKVHMPIGVPMVVAEIGNFNNGYDSKIVPVNLRDIQLSAFGGYLVNQSVKEEPKDACIQNN